MFIRLANTLIGHDGELIRPALSQQFDFEGELALIIGRGGRHIAVAHALDHVAGYTASSMAACATTRRSRLPPQEFSQAPVRSVPGW